MGILDAPGYSRTVADAKIAAAVAASLASMTTSPAIPAVVGTYSTASVTAKTTIGTSRIPYLVGVTGTNVRLRFANWYVNTGVSPIVDADNTAAITIKASVEVGGVIYPVTFGGRLSVTIDGGGALESDPLAVELTAGQVVYVRTFITPTTNWYYNHFSYSAAGTGGWTLTTDLTAPGSAAIPDTSNIGLYGPSMITVEPTTTARLAVLGVGDSLMAGVNDGVGSNYTTLNVSNVALGGGGYVARALAYQGGFVNAGVASDTASAFVATAGHFRRFAFANHAPVLFCEYGRNDVSNGRTLAQVQADLLTIWRLGSGRGKRVFQTTITPKGTSTDGFISLANQTVTTSVNETVRVALNAWLRDGAPLSAATGLAVATGTSGAVRSAYYQGTTQVVTPSGVHPLRAVIEVADAVETARDSGLWKVMANKRTVADAVTTAAGFNITSATAAFTAADVGRTVVIPGAGTSGALFQSVIQTVFNATTISVPNSTATALTGATLTLGDSYTRDGTHPDVYGVNQAAAAIPLAVLGAP